MYERQRMGIRISKSNTKDCYAGSNLSSYKVWVFGGGVGGVVIVHRCFSSGLLQGSEMRLLGCLGH